MPNTEGGKQPFWSSDSRFIGFFAGGKLKKAATAGGAPLTLCDAPDARGGSWSRDDVIVFAPTSAGVLHRVPAGGGVATAVTRFDAQRGESAHRFPHFLPDGKHFLYVTLPQKEQEFPVRMGSMDGGEPVDVMTAWGSPVYAPSGFLLFPRGGALMAQAFDLQRLALVGAAVPVPEVPQVISGLSGANTVSVSSNGVLVLAPGLGFPKKVVWLDREGKQAGELPLPEASYGAPTFSPDGGSVAIFRGSTESEDLLRLDLARGVPTRLTFGPYQNNAPIWSPDGQWIVFASNRGPSRDFYRLSADGAGSEELLVKLEGNFNDPCDWSRDGQFIIYHSLHPQTNNDLWWIPMADEHKPVPFLKTPFRERDARFSPDGRWVAYCSDESGRAEVYVQSFPNPGAKVRVSTDGAKDYTFGIRSVWWPRSDEILYLASDESTVMAVPVEPGETIHVGAPRPLFKLPIGAIQVNASADGKRFLVTLPVQGRAQSALTVVINWDAGLRKP